jgi:hypothetical protein
MSINIKNLTLLRDYLQDKEEALSGTFDMGVYISETSSRSKTFVNIIGALTHSIVIPRPAYWVMPP